MNVIIIGGGASGVLHALYLKKLNKNINVTILEKNDRILKKIMKTGNGRCNISNTNMCPSFYNNINFIQTLYERFKPSSVIEFFSSIGLLMKNDFSTRLYPYSESAKTVIDTLRYELDESGINVEVNKEVINITKNSKFNVFTKDQIYEADVVVIASGSLAQENTRMYQILDQLTHPLTPLTPGLVPLKIKENTKSLQGIKVKCKASIINNGKRIFEEEGELLFKDGSISGVLVLNLSRYSKKESIVSLDLFSNYPNIEEYILGFIDKKSIEDILVSLLPKMLALYIVKICNGDVEKILKVIRDFRLTVKESFGFNQAQIVLGGVDIRSINDDFSSKIFDNLYIIGEVLDIDGSCGGYNLHFAWTSGIVSAISVFEKSL